MAFSGDFRGRERIPLFIVTVILLLPFAGCWNASPEKGANSRKLIVASDTILSGMILTLMPDGHSEVTAILPPDQCPGHYDIKLSDIKKLEEADLIVSFSDSPFMEQAKADSDKWLFIDRKGRNWMAPDSYIPGLNILAGKLSACFPEVALQIDTARQNKIREVREFSENLITRIKGREIFAKAVLASSMQKEPLEWMGFRVVGEYGRPESISAKEIIELSRIGKQQSVIMVVDNLQSGPEAGRALAESLGIPHVVLSNFPSEAGYGSTLRENVCAVLAAVRPN
jgi:zinc transport system substrate-binding protein